MASLALLTACPYFCFHSTSPSLPVLICYIITLLKFLRCALLARQTAVCSVSRASFRVFFFFLSGRPFLSPGGWVRRKMTISLYELKDHTRIRRSLSPALSSLYAAIHGPCWPLAFLPPFLHRRTLAEVRSGQASCAVGHSAAATPAAGGGAKRDLHSLRRGGPPSRTHHGSGLYSTAISRDGPFRCSHIYTHQTARMQPVSQGAPALSAAAFAPFFFFVSIHRGRHL